MAHSPGGQPGRRWCFFFIRIDKEIWKMAGYPHYSWCNYLIGGWHNYAANFCGFCNRRFGYDNSRPAYCSNSYSYYITTLLFSAFRYAQSWCGFRTSYGDLVFDAVGYGYKPDRPL